MGNATGLDRVAGRLDASHASAAPDIPPGHEPGDDVILSELTAYLAEHGRVALKDLSYRFDASPDALRGMLVTLERKGRIRRVEGGAACAATCSMCDPDAMETYEWLGRAGPDADPSP